MKYSLIQVQVSLWNAKPHRLRKVLGNPFGLKTKSKPAEILANQHSPVFEKTIQGLMAQSQSSTGCQNSPESVEAI